MTLLLGFVLGWVVHSLADRVGAGSYEPSNIDPEDAETAARMYGCVKLVVPMFLVVVLGLMIIGRLLSTAGSGISFENPFSVASAQETVALPSPIQTQPSTNMVDLSQSGTQNAPTSQPVAQPATQAVPQQPAAQPTDGAGVFSVQLTTSTGGDATAPAQQTGAAVLDQAIEALNQQQVVAGADGAAAAAQPAQAEAQPIAEVGAVDQGQLSAETAPAAATQPNPDPNAQTAASQANQRPVIDTNGVATFSGTDLTIVGTAPPESVILVMLNGKLYGNAKTDAAGRWVVPGKVTPANYEIFAYVMSPTGLIPSDPVYLNVTQ